jgi:trans-2,3-dihydro-3-hydroxyanthranilate isomerase
MAARRFRIVNVFTHRGDPLSGNPLCVFEDATGLDTATMQRLARQFNLSETTFLTRADDATARVRIFTPAYEMPFAGHPTLGSAYVCRALGWCSDDAVLSMGAGRIPVRAVGSRWTLQANTPTSRPCEATPDALARMLGLTREDIAAPALWVKAGKEQLIVPLASEAAVRRAAPHPGEFAHVRSEDGHSMAYVFAETAPGHALGRFFFPQGSAMLEDPATGSATANLGGWLLATGRTLPVHLEISQGEYTGRPSTLFLDVDAQARIFVSGDVIELGRGTVDV